MENVKRIQDGMAKNNHVVEKLNDK